MKIALAAVLAIAGAAAHAEVTVQDAWARATVPGQAVGAVYMKLHSTADATLVEAQTVAAKDVQVHDMRMHDGIMKMREHGQLSVPAGKTVELAPGGTHLMLLDLTAPLSAGANVKLTMTFADAKQRRHTKIVEVPVRGFGK